MWRVMTILASISMLVSLAGCTKTQGPTAQAPSPTPFSTPTRIPPTATPFVSCAIHESFPYPTPLPTSGIAFASRPDPANHDAVYTGFVTYTGLARGLSVFDGIFITNTGTDAIPVDASHFTATNQKVNWPYTVGKIVPPNSQSTFAIQTYPTASKIVWIIAGTLDTVVIPYTAPSGPTIIPSDQCR